jgi:hypothetical protein
MTEQKPHIYAYLSSDSNEIKRIVEGRRSPLLRDYDFTSDYLRINNRRYVVTNISPKIGAGIKRRWKLSFNPSSVISGRMHTRDINTLVGKLVGAGLLVDIVKNGKVENHKSGRRKR